VFDLVNQTCGTMDYQAIKNALMASTKALIIPHSKNSEFASDFGNLIIRQPIIVAQISCENDIREIFKIANAYKIPVAIRGKGHSSNGQTLTHGIVILNYQSHAKKGDVQFLNDGSVLVPTRITWQTLEETLNKQNRSFPVLTTQLKTTIGGTLSVGGIGVRSIKYGAQIDQVLKLKLILPTGESVWCSAEENNDLFQSSLISLTLPLY